MGELRLQWWRDTIEAFGAGATTGHPIADALGDAARTHKLAPLSLIAMTEARAFDLYDDPMSDEAAFAGYVSKTEAIPFALARQILSDEPASTDLATRAGNIFGQTRLLADLPRVLARGRLPLSVPQLKSAGVDPAALLRGETSQAFADWLEQSCAEIATANASVRNTLRSSPVADRMALLPLATVPATLSAIRATGRDPLRTPAEISPMARVWRIGRARWLGL